MKETPREKDIRQDMQGGTLVPEGYLGDDMRTLEEIIREDQAVLESCNLEREQLADAMRDITHAGLTDTGNVVDYKGYRVMVDEWMGLLPCPFKDGHRVPKRLCQVEKIATGEKVTWSDLHIHLIGQHGFFQGKGTAHRLEPAQLISFLDL